MMIKEGTLKFGLQRVDYKLALEFHSQGNWRGKYMLNLIMHQQFGICFLMKLKS